MSKWLRVVQQVVNDNPDQLFKIQPANGAAIRSRIVSIEDDHFVLEGTDKPKPDLLVPFDQVATIEPIDSK